MTYSTTFDGCSFYDLETSSSAALLNHEREALKTLIKANGVWEVSAAQMPQLLKYFSGRPWARLSNLRRCSVCAGSN